MVDTHLPSNDTLVCAAWMGQEDWDKAQLEFFQKYPGLSIYDNQRPGPYNTDGKLIGTTDELVVKLKAKVT